MVILGGCRTAETVVEPDTVFGHQYELEGPGERTVEEIHPPTGEGDFFTYDAIIDSVIVRAEEAVPGRDVPRPVDVLVMGSFPDACYQLHHIEQTSAGHLITVRLTMRRARGEICMQVLRRYRYYFSLEEALAPGAYTLKLNDRVEPFVVVPPPPAATTRSR
ncbi:hypothetical protein BH23BAC4_BH23BAC4_11400 [soil metagenome]